MLPRERSKLVGFDRLTNAELISLLISTGSRDIKLKDLALNTLKKLEEDGTFHNEDIDIIKIDSLLKQIKGLGIAKRSRILAAFELARRIYVARNLRYTNSLMLYTLFSFLINKRQEYLYVAIFDSGLRILGYKMIYKGGVDWTHIEARDIFLYVLSQQASYFAMVHNHPSGNLTPSKEDIDSTRRIIDLGRTLSVPLIDHVIVSSRGFFSFRSLDVFNS